MLRQFTLAALLSASCAHAQTYPDIPVFVDQDLAGSAFIIVSCPILYEVQGDDIGMIEIAKASAEFYVEESSIWWFFGDQLGITDYSDWYDKDSQALFDMIETGREIGDISQTEFDEMIRKCEITIARYVELKQ